jgi:hypothetical protein
MPPGENLEASPSTDKEFSPVGVKFDAVVTDSTPGKADTELARFAANLTFASGAA